MRGYGKGNRNRANTGDVLYRDCSRRYRELVILRQKIILSAALAGIILFAIALFSADSSKNPVAASDQESVGHYYISVEVEKGDTLWALAQRYVSDENIPIEECVGEICRLNHMTGKDLREGEYVIIPCYAKEMM